MTKIVIFLFASAMVFLFGVLFDTLDFEEFGIILYIIGGFGFIFSLFFLAVAFIDKVELASAGPDYEKLDDYIVIISTYNEKDKTDTPILYSKMIDKIDEYNKTLEKYYDSYNFYNVDIPDRLKEGYPKIAYDYVTNEAKWEDGEVVVYGK